MRLMHPKDQLLTLASIREVINAPRLTGGDSEVLVARLSPRHAEWTANTLVTRRTPLWRALSAVTRY